MIFYRKGEVNGIDLENAINNAVFPGLQVRNRSGEYQRKWSRRGLVGGGSSSGLRIVAGV